MAIPVKNRDHWFVKLLEPYYNGGKMRSIHKWWVWGLVLGLSMVLLSQEKTEPVSPDSLFKVQNIAPFWYASLEYKGSYAQHASAFQTLYTEAGKQGIQGGLPFGIYYNNPENTPEAELQWEVGFALKDSIGLQAPLQLKKWPFTTIATTFYRGVFGDTTMGQLYQKFFTWIGEKGYVPCGPAMEKFLAPPTPNEKGEMILQTQIVIPVEKLKK